MLQTEHFSTHNVKLCAESARTSGPTPGRTASNKAVVAQEQKTQLAKPFYNSETKKGCQIAEMNWTPAARCSATALRGFSVRQNGSSRMQEP
jgi:hypothetical protein